MGFVTHCRIPDSTAALVTAAQLGESVTLELASKV